MIDPAQLANDVVANVVTLALPGAVWAVLFLVAWEHGPFAESLGFGRATFWLLLPGALLASLTILPIAPIANDWLAVSFAGGLFPFIVAALAYRKLAPGGSPSLGVFVATIALVAVVLLVLVLPVADPIGGRLAGALGTSTTVALDLAVLLATALLVLVIGGVAGRSAAGGRFAAVLALLGGVLVLTFVASAALPGVGISETFPIYLVPPIGAGFIAVVVAPRVFPGAEGLALPAAYIAATFGVLIGADVLRQPPLYGAGPSGVYAIGGAGVLDLVYLSGLLAFGTAYVTHRAIGRPLTAVGPSAYASSPGPAARLAKAFREGVFGRIDESLKGSALAGREAAERAHLVLGIPPAPEDRPWQGLPVPGWVVSDEANLAAAARAGTTDGREGYRGWATARWLVQIGRDLTVRRFASAGRRALAFGIDLAVVLVPATAIWVALVLRLPGGLVDVASSDAFNVAAYGFVALSFLYFVLAETLGGTTVGKALLGLAVRDRKLEAPDFLGALLRNVSLLPLLSVVGLGVPVALLFLLKSGAGVSISLAGIPIPGGVFAFVSVIAFVLGGVGVLGTFGILVISVTGERQRLGDLIAGTWVVRNPTAAAPPARGAPGAGPSG